MKLWHIKSNYSWKHYTMFLSEVNYRNKIDQNQTMRFKILKKWKAASFPKNILSILELKELLSLLAKKVYCIKENLSMRFIQSKMFQSFIPSSGKRKDLCSHYCHSTLYWGPQPAQKEAGKQNIKVTHTEGNA